MAHAVPDPNPDYRLQPENTRGLDHIPGDYGLPYLGHAITLMNDTHGWVQQRHERYGLVSKVRLAGQTGLLVLGPDIYQQIYLDRDRNFSAEMGYKRQLGAYYHGGLLLRDFDEHRVQRRIFQTAFKTEAMKGYIGSMNPVLGEHMDAWQQQRDFHFFPAIKSTLLEVGSRIFIGIGDPDKMDLLTEAFLKVNEGLLGLIRKDIPGLRWHTGMKGKRELRNFFFGLVPQRRTGQGTDMLTYMCQETTEDGSHFSDEDIVQHAGFLLFAAHDTTTSALTHMILHTARHPEWQERLRAESQALGKPVLDYDDIDRMEGLELVFREALRLHPSVQIMTRRTIRECEIGGYRVPANTMLFLSPTFSHTMPEYWSNPQQFDPERFLPPREEHKNHSFGYMPFGGGAHKCIGMHFANMQAKCFMHQFLLKYRYRVADGYDPRLLTVPLPKPADDLPLALQRIA